MISLRTAQRRTTLHLFLSVFVQPFELYTELSILISSLAWRPAKPKDNSNLFIPRPPPLLSIPEREIVFFIVKLAVVFFLLFLMTHTLVFEKNMYVEK